ncbi:TrbG/VirB9 family P-type conjugative transfer protein [Massilia sp. CCM 9210]|uniref:TrbG/VirB9 family P-type conjugative transfer protein n=1 Tax=Massilia scottii TaxID=3057166 RepID=UPI00279665C1|nr:TrbG/VirB9 family P-type conjugative transfer protein [Massilia sp. CCM 9210]MDQ1817824.1 TrbG/VirB9 family P-type conjugative transfer protein [Massilia sp. CCM 9210]
MIKELLTISLVSLSCFASANDFEPEGRIREEVYSSRKVYTFYAKIGKATVIEFQEGETIDPKKTDLSVLGMGFGSGWDIGSRAHTFLLKPKHVKPDSNLILVTNKRRYVFDVKLAPNRVKPTYVITFTYPEDQKREQAEQIANANRMAALAASAQASKDKITEEARAKRIVVNTEYNWRGENQRLRPTAAWDDGLFTHLEYKHSAELPLFYKVLPDGSEALINQNVAASSGYVTVLQEIVPIIRARLGEDMIEIVNRNYKVPEYNNTGTSVHGAVRVEKSGGVRNVE